MVALRTILVSGLTFILAACATSSDRTGYDSDTPATDPAGGEGGGGGAPPSGFGEKAPPATLEEVEINEVYGNSATTLFKLEPKTKNVTIVGNFKNCAQITDIALDEQSNLFGVSSSSLYSIDKATATCTLIKLGSYPNSLSFVPKGTVDANEEALVGYDKSTYIRIDVKTGARTTIGKLGDKLESSGDIVSVKNGKSYLTVKGDVCNTFDCLVEIDPTTGAMVKNWGSVEHKNVFGLSFWGGKVYGFDDGGNLFEVTFGPSQITSANIVIPQKPAGLSFWGAGSSTSVPLESGPQ